MTEQSMSRAQQATAVRAGDVVSGRNVFCGIALLLLGLCVNADPLFSGSALFDV